MSHTFEHGAEHFSLWVLKARLASSESVLAGNSSRTTESLHRDQIPLWARLHSSRSMLSVCVSESWKEKETSTASYIRDILWQTGMNTTSGKGVCINWFEILPKYWIVTLKCEMITH